MSYLQYKATWDISAHPISDNHGRFFRVYATSQWYQHIDMEASNYKEIIKAVNKLFDLTNDVWNHWRTDFESIAQQHQSQEVDQPGDRKELNRLYVD
jgi:hypothetical protein